MTGNLTSAVVRGLALTVVLTVALTLGLSVAPAVTPCGAQSPARRPSQGPTRIDAGGDLAVGGEAERYWRVLQLAGLAPMQPWTIRPLYAPASAGFVASADHPWDSRWQPDTQPRLFDLRWLRPGVRVAFNSAFPFEVSSGPAWAGRGLTADVEGGVVATLWRVRVQVAPSAFIAQNQAFTLAPNGLAGADRFRDARFPNNIDAPQRFGDKAYSRLDPGNSTISLDLSRAVIGLSTAAQSWGPAREYPLILSANSGGFPHAFLATRTPIDLGVMRLGARLIGGRLSQTQFSAASNPANRWASGLVFTIMPKGLNGLEVGMARFIAGPSPNGIPTWQHVARVFRTEIRTETDNVPNENQVASAFFRWAVPRSGIEVYGEYYREDFAVEPRRFAQYPDDYATYVIGLHHARSIAPGRIRAFRFEIVNGEISSSNRRERGSATDGGYRLGGPQPPYLHGSVPQGHTNNGLFLGSPEAYGGAAWRLGADEYDAHGRSSISLERRLRLDWLPGTSASSAPPPDLLYAVRAERVRFVGSREYSVTIIPMIDLNHNLKAGHDLFNLSVALSVRGLR